MSPDNGGLIDYSELEVGVFEAGKTQTLQKQEFPISIEPRHAKAIIVGLNIPVLDEQSKGNTCFQPNASIRQVEVCYFSNGHDLFGNPVEYREYPSEHGKPFVSASWSEDNKSPTFITTIRTADGSEFYANLQYYPVL